MIPTEIERRFLLRGDLPIGALGIRPDYITQGYFDTTGATTRIRIRHNSHDKVRGLAHLCIKGPKNNTGGVAEFEYEIPVAHAEYMIDNFCGQRVLSKNRYVIPYESKVDSLKWEIDVFSHVFAGLHIVEIEVPRMDYPLVIPNWVGREITTEPVYSNRALAYAQRKPAPKV